MAGKKKNRSRKTTGENADLQSTILGLIASKPAKGVSLKNILKRIATSPQAEGVFDAIQDLVTRQKIEEFEHDRFRIPRKGDGKDLHMGVVDMTQSGNAYVVIDGHLNDVFVPQRKTLRAFNGDTVKVRITRSREGKPEGEIVAILKREKELFIGTVEISDTYAFAVTDHRFNNYDFYLPAGEIARSKVKQGDRVIVRMSDWPPTMKNPIGQIVSRLAKPGDHASDMEALLVDTGIQYAFPKDVEKEAARIRAQIPDSEIARRRDLRKLLTFTIDPYDAKDFDDAISYRKLPNGNVEVGIHIADVSHFVVPGSAIDREAYARGTSVYLVDRVIPMLPEKLSNQVCSLVPNQDRLCFSVIVEMDDKALVHNTWFGRTVIHSKRRFTYEEVQGIIEIKNGDHVAEILELNRLAGILRKKRYDNGAISFETQEVKFILDEKFVPTGIYVKERKEAHMLIEDFMLLANRLVAESHKGKKATSPFVYRVHDIPDMDKVREFGLHAKRFGYKLKLDTPKQVASEFNRLLVEVKGKPEQNILENLAIRCMAKAVYTTHNIGHYGLAFPQYTHFTSPIRRYPDLMVHRMMEHMLSGKLSTNLKKEDVEDNCRHASAMERKAMEAERESVKYKQVEYMSQSVGKKFDGIISGITHFGIFVVLVENKCEGMIRTDSVHDELMFDESRRRLVSMTQGRNFELGDRVRIRVKKADLASRTLDFELA